MNGRRTIRPRRGGFTLIEMLIVVSLIVLIATIALPSIVGMFAAGAEARAYNTLAAQVASARALAIKNATYALLHVQIGEGPDFEDTCWSAVFEYRYDEDDGRHYFVSLDGYRPRAFAGATAFGEISGTFVIDDDGDGAADEYTNLDLDEDFTTFSIVFDPNGEVVTNVDGGRIVFDPDDPLFDELWDVARTEAPPEAGEYGVTAMTVFDYVEFINISDADDRADYLDEAGQFLPVNRYTGRLMEREQ